MTKDEIIEDIEATVRGLPERPDGEYSMTIIERKVGFFLKTSRPAVVEAMRDWLGRQHEFWTLAALRVACTFKLVELCPTIKEVRDEIVAGRLFLPYYVQFVDQALLELGCDQELP